MTPKEVAKSVAEMPIKLFAEEGGARMVVDGHRGAVGGGATDDCDAASQYARGDCGPDGWSDEEELISFAPRVNWLLDVTHERVYSTFLVIFNLWKFLFLTDNSVIKLGIDIYSNIELS
jgi:hypothetical protein